MPAFVRAICACYSMLLVLHSRKLRDAYGHEMVDVMREEMLEALRAGGPLGAMRPAARAFGELVTIAIPSRVNQERAGVVALAACTSLAMLLSLWRVLLNQDILDPWMRTIGLQCR